MPSTNDTKLAVSAALAQKSSKNALRMNASAINRKLEMDFINSLDKRQQYENEFMRRRIRSVNIEKTSSSSSASSICGSACGGGGSSAAQQLQSSELEDETELKELLAQSKNRLENTDALRIRSHLLRPEDYVRYENYSIDFINNDENDKDDEDNNDNDDENVPLINEKNDNNHNHFEYHNDTNIYCDLGFNSACKLIFIVVVIIVAALFIYMF